MSRPGLSAGVALVVVLVCLAVVAEAHITGVVRLKCPIDGTRFEAQVDLSGTSWGRRLDLKPDGPTPAPWSLPLCPTCRFPQFEEPLSRELRKRVRRYVLSPEYQLLAKDHPSYFLAAKIYEFLGRDAYAIGEAYLEASWQVEDEDRDRYESYLRLARDAFLRFEASADPEMAQITTVQLLIGELHRLLGEFERAEAHFESLSRHSAFQDDPLQDLIAYERKLIAARDLGPHDVPPLRPSAPPGSSLALARSLPGFEKLSERWAIRATEMGPVNGEPPSLFVVLEALAPGEGVDEVRWYDTLSAGRPVYDWNDFGELLARAEAAVRRHPWLNDWRQTDPAKRLRIELSGLGVREQRGIGSDLFERFVLSAWEDAGLADRPRYEVALSRSLGGECATMYLADTEDGALVVDASPCAGDHWLDRTKVRFHPRSSPEYLVVLPDGSFERRRLAAKPRRLSRQ